MNRTSGCRPGGEVEMKEKVKKCGKELGQALMQLIAWGGVGLFVGIGMAVGFFATLTIMLH